MQEKCFKVWPAVCGKGVFVFVPFLLALEAHEYEVLKRLSMWGGETENRYGLKDGERFAGFEIAPPHLDAVLHFLKKGGYTELPEDVHLKEVKAFAA